METNLKTPHQKHFENTQQSIAIQFSLAVKNSFELYSYRILEKESFLQRLQEIVETREEQNQKNKSEFAINDLPVFETGENINHIK